MKLRVTHLLLAGALLLGGCQGVPTLNGGEATALDADANAARMQLQVATMMGPPLAGYHPTKGCSFRMDVRQLDAADNTAPMTLSIRKVSQDRLMVSRRQGDDNAIYVIDSSGRLFDYNTFDPALKKRMSSDTAQALAQSQRQMVANQRNPHVLNLITALLPQFHGSNWTVGDVVADVETQDAGVWAQYVYRGTVQYGGRNAILLDLMRLMPGNSANIPRLVGYMIFDPSAMMPVSMTLEAGLKIHMEQNACDA